MRIKALYSAILTMLFQKLSIGIKLHMAEMFSRKERKLDTILTQTSLEFSHTGKTILLKDLKFCWFFCAGYSLRNVSPQSYACPRQFYPIRFLECLQRIAT